MAYEWIKPAADVIGAGAQYLTNIHGQQQQRTAMQQQQNQLNGGRLGQLGAEDELQARMNMINRVAPQLRTQNVQQPTVTPFQSLMSNAALFGAIPGMAQQVMPGLLPAIGRTGSVGKSIQNLFGPDTSHIDAASAEATRNFQERVVPSIMAQYGEGQDQAREYAIRQAGQEFMRDIEQRRAGAYERGLGRMDANTANLLGVGMRPQFENVERPVEQPSPAAQQAQAVREKANTLFGKSETRTDKKTGKQYKVGAGGRFDKLYDKANDTQKMMMQRVLDKYPDRKSMPSVVQQLNTPDEYERFFQVTESQDPVVRSIADRIIKQGGGSTKRDLMTIAQAIKSENADAINRVMARRGFEERKRGFDWKLAKGVALPVAAMAAAPIAAKVGVASAAKTAIPTIAAWLSGKSANAPVGG